VADWEAVLEADSGEEEERNEPEEAQRLAAEQTERDAKESREREEREKETAAAEAEEVAKAEAAAAAAKPAKKLNAKEKKALKEAPLADVTAADNSDPDWRPKKQPRPRSARLLLPSLRGRRSLRRRGRKWWKRKRTSGVRLLWTSGSSRRLRKRPPRLALTQLYPNPNPANPANPATAG
jgi:translation initiation factor IF-2